MKTLFCYKSLVVSIDLFRFFFMPFCTIEYISNQARFLPYPSPHTHFMHSSTMFLHFLANFDVTNRKLIEVNWTLTYKWPFLKCILFYNKMNFLKKKKKKDNAGQDTKFWVHFQFVCSWTVVLLLFIVFLHDIEVFLDLWDNLREETQPCHNLFFADPVLTAFNLHDFEPFFQNSLFHSWLSSWWWFQTPDFATNELANSSPSMVNFLSKSKYSTRSSWSILNSIRFSKLLTIWQKLANFFIILQKLNISVCFLYEG